MECDDGSEISSRVGPSLCTLGSNNNVEALAAFSKCGRGCLFFNSDLRKGPIRKRCAVSRIWREWSTIAQAVAQLLLEYCSKKDYYTNSHQRMKGEIYGQVAPQAGQASHRKSNSHPQAPPQ